MSGELPGPLAQPVPAAQPEPEQPSPPAGPDWTDQVTDLIVDTVDKVRERTAGPAFTAARFVVYGLMIMIVAVPAIVLLLAGLVRLFDWAIPQEVWLAYLILGAISVGVGGILWGRRGSARLG